MNIKYNMFVQNIASVEKLMISKTKINQFFVKPQLLKYLYST